MSYRIPDNFLDSLKSRLDLADIIQSHGVTLKKTGRNLVGLCPFHNEKSPSFSVNNENHFYYCFGCGASGDAITFVLERTGIAFRDAVQQLATQVGMDLPKPDLANQDFKAQEQRNYRKKLESLMESAANWFQLQLQTEEGSFANHYLHQIRRLDSGVLGSYGVGYAPNQWDSLKSYLLSQGYTDKMLIDSGMVSVQEGQNHTFDRFRGRVIFPIRNTQGKVAAFGGRVLDDSKPKYLNSPETHLYSKSNEVYGLLEARRNTRNLDRLIVVEGYMDVIALANASISNAVAPLGTAITEQQIDKLLRSSNHLVFCFDGDQAGQSAALKALEIITPKMIDARDFRFMLMPEGKDPNDLVLEIGANNFINLLDKSLPAIDYILKLALGDLDLTREGDKVAYAGRLAEWLHKMPDSLYASKLLQVACEKTGFDKDRVLLTAAAKRKAAVTLPPTDKPGDDKDKRLLSRNLCTLFCLLWDHPELSDLTKLAQLEAALSNLIKDANSKTQSSETHITLLSNVLDLSKSIGHLLQLESNRANLSFVVLHYYWHGTPMLEALCRYREAAKDWLVDLPASSEGLTSSIEAIAQGLIEKSNQLQVKETTENQSENLNLSDRFKLIKEMKLSNPAYGAK